MTGEIGFYRRGIETALAAWALFARTSAGAAVMRLPGVAAAVFPEGPERAVYNNAVLDQGLPGAQRAEALVAMETAYATAKVERFAAWVHEHDDAMRVLLERRGYRLQETTRAMGMELDDLRVTRPSIQLGSPDLSRHLELIGMPTDFLAGVDEAALHVVVAQLDGESVATALAFDFDGDCGIFNVATVESLRHRGLGTALTAVQLHDAKQRGCRTASLQATLMAERLYAGVGFRDLGRILEFGPPSGTSGGVGSR